MRAWDTIMRMTPRSPPADQTSMHHVLVDENKGLSSLTNPKREQGFVTNATDAMSNTVLFYAASIWRKSNYSS